MYLLMTHWAAPIRIVGRDEESELEHGSIVDATTNTQQTIPNCGVKVHMYT